MSHSNVQAFMKELKSRTPHQPEFHQAAEEIVESCMPHIKKHDKYQGHRLLSRLCEPDRVLYFRVTWMDDNEKVQVNRGYRVQFNNAIGPYKGGLRFHPTVNLSVLKFLAFEQIFKNSLTGLPMGGAKGGADFDPKGRSDAEIMRFCQSFMSELQYYIGPNIDVPAGDIGVGTKEIGYLFGMYKKLKRKHNGTLTGKGFTFGGSLIRPEATGYGLIYFLMEMLSTQNDGLADKKITISGSGNVAQYAAEQALQQGAKVITLSDSSGTIYDKEGINQEKLDWVKWLKTEKKGRIKEYASEFGADYLEGKKPWNIDCDIALPCATQNEMDEEDAKSLIKNGCMAIAEGANMPLTSAALNAVRKSDIFYAPGKATNAGGVATSGLEMSQNSLHLSWSREEVLSRLKGIMSDIHNTCTNYGEQKDGQIDYVQGANLGGFVKVADAIIALGVV